MQGHFDWKFRGIRLESKEIASAGLWFGWCLRRIFQRVRGIGIMTDRAPRAVFPPSSRIRTTGDFERAYNSGLRAGDAHLLIFASVNGTQRTRVGLSVSRKHGGAVQRNRKKRLLREAFRHCAGRLPAGLDLVLVPRQRPDSCLHDFCNSLPALVRRLARRIPAQDDAPGTG